MESIARPLRRLQEDAAWFARAHEVRLMHVRTDATLRGPVMDLLMSQEHHADNRALFFRFDDPVTGPARGWVERVARLREQWAKKIEEVAPAEIVLRPLAEPQGGGGGGAAFARALFQTAGALAAPLTQVMAVLAPTQVEDAAMFLQEVSSLILARELQHVRWIVVEVDGAACASLVGQLGKAAAGCLCLVDENEQQKDLAALAGAGGAPPPPPVRGAAPPPPLVPDGPFPLWRAQGAMPDVAAPPRVNALPPPTDEALRAAGLSPKFVKGGGELLKQTILGAALALRKGKHIDAITMQARAAELCAEMEMPREQILNLHVLGGYLLAGQVRARAREVYARAGELARTHELPELEAQSELALGMLEAMERKPAEAAAHYASAGRLAEAAKAEILAIECWRMAGQLALDAKLESSTVDCWKRALSLAEPLEPEVAQATSAAEIARALAALCRRRGLVAQAQQLEQQSMNLEQGPDAPPSEKAAS